MILGPYAFGFANLLLTYFIAAIGDWCTLYQLRYIDIVPQ